MKTMRPPVPDGEATGRRGQSVRGREWGLGGGGRTGLSVACVLAG